VLCYREQERDPRFQCPSSALPCSACRHPYGCLPHQRPIICGREPLAPPALLNRLAVRQFPPPPPSQVFSPAREFFYLQGEEGELKALVSHYLRSQLGEAYDLEVFNDAWESGTEMEVATKRRKAALTGVDKSRIKTTNKTITLRFETRIMKNNARAALVLKLWQTYREVLNLPKRPKGEQIQGGQKRHVIEDPEWEVHAKQMQGKTLSPLLSDRLAAWRGGAENLCLRRPLLPSCFSTAAPSPCSSLDHRRPTAPPRPHCL